MKIKIEEIDKYKTFEQEERHIRKLSDMPYFKYQAMREGEWIFDFWFILLTVAISLQYQ